MSRDLAELEPKTRELCQKLLEGCNEAGFPVIVCQTYRSFEEQEGLFAKGRTRPGPIVTYARAGYSWHNFRRAFDVVFLKGTDISWMGPWEKVGEIGRALGLIWGGDWQHGKQDRPHFEYHPDLTLEEARNRSMVPKTREYIA